MKEWASNLTQIATTITAAMLLACGATMITISNQQVRLVTQIEGITKNLDTLTVSVKELETRVRTLEAKR